MGYFAHAQAVATRPLFGGGGGEWPGNEATVDLVYFLACVTHRVEGWEKGEFLCGRGQLPFSGNKGRQRNYTSCSCSSEPVCDTDQALKQCHHQKVEKCNRLSSGRCPRKSNYVR